MVPLPTYFITAGEGATRPLPSDGLDDGAELCGNLTWLGHAGRTEVAGLSVAFLSGLYDGASYATAGNTPARGSYSEEVVEELLIEANAYRKDVGIDLLLTAEWGGGSSWL